MEEARLSVEGGAAAKQSFVLLRHRPVCTAYSVCVCVRERAPPSTLSLSSSIVDALVLCIYMSLGGEPSGEADFRSPGFPHGEQQRPEQGLYTTVTSFC